MNDDTDFRFGANAEENHFNEETEVCGGTVECRACGKFHGWCNEVEAKLKGEQMLPTSAPSGDQKSTINKRTGGLQFLKDEMLTKQPQEAKILAVRYNPDGKFGAAVDLKLAFQGKQILYSITIASNAKSRKGELTPNYQTLLNTFGSDENEWVEKLICLHLEEDPFDHRMQRRVTVQATSRKRGS